MTKTLSKEEILAIIREKCPELKELKFGAVVEVLLPEYGEPSDGIEYTPAKVGYATYIEPSEPMTFLDGNHMYDIYASDFKNGETEYVDEEDGITATIIGLEPQLNHLLIACLAKFNRDTCYDCYFGEKHKWCKAGSHLEYDKSRKFIISDILENYSLNKSVPENLENEQLRALLTNLLQ